MPIVSQPMLVWSVSAIKVSFCCSLLFTPRLLVIHVGACGARVDETEAEYGQCQQHVQVAIVTIPGKGMHEELPHGLYS